MNWATVAPETRIYKGKSLYRWELSPGVHHHCGTCATPLSNAHAKTTCLGKHVEPCYRFHQQLHFVGKSHECFGCNSSDEKHYQRHKEILKIVRQINQHDQVCFSLSLGRANEDGKQRWESGPATIDFPTDTGSESVDNEDFKISMRERKKTKHRWDSTSIIVSSPTDTGSESVETEDCRMSRRERKRAKKAGNGPARDRPNLELFPKEETDFISEAIHLCIHESKGAWEGTYVYTHQRPEANENTSVVEEDTELDDFETFRARMETLAVKPPSSMTPRQRKVVKKFTTPINHSNYGGGSRRYSGRSPNAEVDPYDGVNPDIFFRLGIEVTNPTRNSRARKELIIKLVSAVKEDLDIIEREETESALREEGFWRWAGRTAYHSIVDIRTELDWATGQKKGAPKRPRSSRDQWLESGELAEKTAEEISDFEASGSESPYYETPQLNSGRESDSDQISRKKGLENKSSDTPEPLRDDANGDWTKVGAKSATSSKIPKSAKQTLKFKSNHAVIEEEGEDFAEMISRHNQRLAGERNIGGQRSVFNSAADRRKGGRALTFNLK